MDFVKNAMGGGDSNSSGMQQGANKGSNQQNSSGSGFLGGISNKLNSAAGGGQEGEKNEDLLDKGRCQKNHVWRLCRLLNLRPKASMQFNNTP